MVKFGKVTVEIKGLTPLLMNKVNAEDLQQGGSTGPKGKTYVPEEEAKKHAYRTIIDGKEQLYIPSYAIYSMLVSAGAGYKPQGKRFSFKSILAGGIHVEPEEVSLGTNEYVIDERSVVIQRARVLAWRPKIKEWKAQFTIIYNETVLDENNILIIKKILEDAGVRYGLLDYRPQHKGWFGTFEVTKFEIQS